ncbi:uncharacterized protein BKA78DRAFT_20808 [Phyllosticta capitalensis]|uniref:uncharacterized protein n=1 Tax=Phyllosticta capitalensis TaxID=121624 RepID=UPI00312EF8EB
MQRELIVSLFGSWKCAVKGRVRSISVEPGWQGLRGVVRCRVKGKSSECAVARRFHESAVPKAVRRGHVWLWRLCCGAGPDISLPEVCSRERTRINCCVLTSRQPAFFIPFRLAHDGRIDLYSSVSHLDSHHLSVGGRVGWSYLGLWRLGIIRRQHHHSSSYGK